MRKVLRNPVPESASFGAAVVKIARQHFAQRPIEIGGQNMGPWVRMYMQGHDGYDYPWCAGFITFIMRQAAEALHTKVPIIGSFSCDSLAGQAREEGRYVHERDVTVDKIKPGTFFLVRREPTDWTHTGIVIKADRVGFSTIEGNTNDSGSRDGFEVCAQTRGYSNKDFILISD